MISMGLRILSDAPEFVPTGNKKGDTPVIRLDKLCFRRGKKHIFDDLSAEFYRGQITAITGHNGVGKTTLCRIITGELRQRKGSVCFFGENTPAKRRIRDCFFVGQDADYQIFTPTVLQEITLNTEIRSRFMGERLKQNILRCPVNRHRSFFLYPLKMKSNCVIIF